MKLIFLDIDGVLNNAHTRETYEGYTFVEDSKIELLKQIIGATEAKVVLSSTWRSGWYCLEHVTNPTESERRDIRLFEALRDKLQEHGIELLSYTDDFGLRGEEIDQWMTDWKDGEGEPIETFIILDDMGGREMRPHSRYLVQTGWNDGLTEKHVARAIKLLNGDL